jgi:hypothetical protein
VRSVIVRGGCKRGEWTARSNRANLSDRANRREGNRLVHRGGGGAIGGDVGEDGANLNHVILTGGDRRERPGNGAGNLSIDFVGRDLDQGLVHGDVIANRLEPSDNSGLGDALAEPRHRHWCGHSR